MRLVEADSKGAGHFTGSLSKGQIQHMHGQIYRAPMGIADVAAIAAPAHVEGERRMRIVVKRTERPVTPDRQTQMVSHLLNGQFADAPERIFSYNDFLRNRFLASRTMMPLLHHLERNTQSGVESSNRLMVSRSSSRLNSNGRLS